MRRAIVLSVTAAVAIAVAGGASGLFAVFAIVLFAYVLGRGIQSSKPYLAPVHASLALILCILLVLAMGRAAGISVITIITKQVQQAVAGNATWATLSGVSPADLGQLVMAEAKLYLPGLLVILAGGYALVNLAITRWALVRSRHALATRGILRGLRFPRLILSVYAVSVVFVISGWGSNVPLLWQTVNNLWIITTFLVGLQAVSLGWWFVRTMRMGILIVLGLLILSTVPVVSDLYLVVGAIDIVWNIRTRRMRRS